MTDLVVQTQSSTGRRCPKLSDLPAPPLGKTGWPWTEESTQLPDHLPDGRSYPLITIVTPSYQQGEFIEATIRSILLQGYPNLEYIIMDGGSQDETVEVIRKYEAFIQQWVSEPDRGQSHAINKGWAVAQGDILHYLNSDDLLLPGALATVAHTFTANETVQAVSGICSVQDLPLLQELRIKEPRDFNLEHFLMGVEGPGQPAVFLTKEIAAKVGEFDESLHYTMDREYWTRISLLCPDIHAIKLDERLAIFRWRSECKSAQGSIAFAERVQLLEKIFSRADLPEHVKQMKRRAYTVTLWPIAQSFKQEKLIKEALVYSLKSLYWNPKLLKAMPQFFRELLSSQSA
ncbi:glycosyltransferase family 2 protein [Phormidesmis sp. 146-12]